MLSLKILKVFFISRKLKTAKTPNAGTTLQHKVLFFCCYGDISATFAWFVLIVMLKMKVNITLSRHKVFP